MAASSQRAGLADVAGWADSAGDLGRILVRTVAAAKAWVREKKGTRATTGPSGPVRVARVFASLRKLPVAQVRTLRAWCSAGASAAQRQQHRARR
jgi:hypothetical protein